MELFTTTEYNQNMIIVRENICSYRKYYTYNKLIQCITNVTVDDETLIDTHDVLQNDIWGRLIIQMLLGLYLNDREIVCTYQFDNWFKNLEYVEENK